jgi:hypothetical protein
MRGLDPRIHLLREKVLTKIGVKPGNDDLNLAPMGTGPRMMWIQMSETSSS